MNRDQLLAAMDQLAVEKPRAVFIKGIGDCHIRRITIGELDDQIADTADKKNKRACARGACRLLSDEAGNRLLDPENETDVNRMARLPIDVLTAVNKTAEEDSGN